MRLLYVTWDGPDFQYLDSLFFPLFARLRRRGVETHVVQFSWDLPRFAPRTAASARQWGVGYEVHEVPRRPLQAATALAMGFGAAQLVRSVRRVHADVVMPRAHIPVGMALAAGPLLRRPLVWDSDGLMPDERLDFGGWAERGVNYRLFRRLERAALSRARAVLTRTRAAATLLAERAQGPVRFEVVPNGKDEAQFRPATDAERAEVRARLGVRPDAPLLVYVGSLGPQYRPAEMARVFARVLARRPDAHWLVLTGAEAALREALRQTSVPEGSVTVRRVPAGDVAEWVRGADAGLSFREPSRSMRAVCPIKVVEYLLSGVPVLTNTGVGDLDVQFAGSDAGVAVDGFGDDALEQLAEAFTERVLPAGAALRAEARALGLRTFSLDACAEGYLRALS